MFQKNKSKIKKIVITSVFIAILFCLNGALADTSYSTNYQIIYDSIGSGGDLSSSSSYKDDSSVGSFGGEAYGDSFLINSGYQKTENQVYTISIASSGDASLGNIDGFNGGSASADISWTVITDNPSGYKVSISKDHLLNIDGGGIKKEFSDLISDQSTTPPSYSWPSPFPENTAHFGFSLNSLGSGVSAYQRYLHANTNPFDCNSGGGIWTSLSCWDTIPDITPMDIFYKNSSSGGVGTVTSIKVKAQVGETTSGSYMKAGVYETVITATVSML